MLEILLALFKLPERLLNFGGGIFCDVPSPGGLNCLFLSLIILRSSFLFLIFYVLGTPSVLMPCPIYCSVKFLLLIFLLLEIVLLLLIVFTFMVCHYSFKLVFLKIFSFFSLVIPF